MTKPAIGDIVLYNFKIGDEKKGLITCQRPAMVLAALDDKTLNLSVFIDKLWDGKLGFSADELRNGLAYRSTSVKGTGNGQWAARTGSDS